MSCTEDVGATAAINPSHSLLDQATGKLSQKFFIFLLKFVLSNAL